MTPRIPLCVESCLWIEDGHAGRYDPWNNRNPQARFLGNFETIARTVQSIAIVKVAARSGHWPRRRSGGMQRHPLGKIKQPRHDRGFPHIASL